MSTNEPAVTDAAVPAVPPWRALATRVVGVLLALITGLAFFSLPLLVLSWAPGEPDLIHQVHGIGWGVLAGLLLSVGLAAHAIGPRLVATLQQAAAVIVALLVATTLGGASGLPELAPFVLAIALLVWLSPARAAFADLTPRSRVLVALVVLAAIPLAVYALDQAALSRAAAPTDPHVDPENHYESMTGVAIGLVLTGLVAAARRPGWRVPLWCTGIGAALFGLMSLISDQQSSVGPIWGAVALAGGIGFIAAGEVEARRTSTATTTPRIA